jgi:hypothetical protein
MEGEMMDNDDNDDDHSRNFDETVQTLIELWTGVEETGQFPAGLDMRVIAKLLTGTLRMLQIIQRQKENTERLKELDARRLNNIITMVRNGMGLDEVLFMLEQEAEFDENIKMKIEAEKRKNRDE